MNKIFILSLSFVLSFTASAKDCLKVDKDQINLSWTAYKTPLKAGVNGALKDIQFSSKLQGSSIEEIVGKAKFKVLTHNKSVFTKNPARDAKISKFFFSTMKNEGTLEASVKSFNKKKLVLSLTMNGVTKDVPLSPEVKGMNFKAKGHIDVLDFLLSDSLKAINKACFALHEGKTWSDVAISIEAKFSKCQ